MNWVISTMVVAVLAASAAGQDACPLKTSEGLFHWDFRQAQELKLGQAINKSPALTDAERTALVKQIATQLRRAMANLGIESEHELLTIAARTRIELVDLNDDGTPEIIAQPVGLKAGCGATGNCPFWVFAKSNSGYDLILEGGGQVFTVEPTRTNGFSDLVLGTHDSADEQTLYLYCYREGKYHEHPDCYHAEWWCRNCSPPHSLTEPKIVKSAQCRD
jgi:hypothetical protein